MTVELEKYYNRLIAEIEKDESTLMGNLGVNQLYNRLVATNRRVAEYTTNNGPKKKKKSQLNTLSESQISQLSQLIKRIPNTATAEVLKIIT